jgi:hypothetical protein
MTIDVPAVVHRYLKAAEAGDETAVAGCFTEDAVVRDDGRTHAGRAAIIAWREGLAGGPSYTVEVIGGEPAGPGRHLVVADVAGDFPGSPVRLTYAFTVRHDLISELVIAP